MPNEEINLDPDGSDLRIGIELEYPEAPSWDKKLTAFGRWSRGLRDEVRNDGWPSSIGGQAVHDGTVGLEVVSPGAGIPLADAPKWYADAVDYLEQEWNAPHSPSGRMEESTAGLHLHLSPLTREQAEALYDISTTAWAKVMFCSSIAQESNRMDWRVFRGEDYCTFGGGVQRHTRDTHYACVNHRGDGHYEWRMPEPVIPEHFELIVKWLRIFEQDVDEAIQFAQEVLDAGDDRITSIRRAEMIGVDLLEEQPIRRAPAEIDDFFYQQVAAREWLPQIYTVQTDDGTFYTFDSRLEGVFEVDGIEFSPDDILYANSLDLVEDPQLQQEVNNTFDMHGRSPVEETEATHYVKDIVKKKGGA